MKVEIYLSRYYIAINHKREHGLNANKKMGRSPDTFLQLLAVACLKFFHLHMRLPHKCNWD